MRSKGVYVNTLDIEALPLGQGGSAKKLVEIPIPPSAPLLAAWKLGIDTEFADTEGIRIVAMLQVGPAGCADDPPAATITEILDSFLFRTGRALQAPPVSLPAPYEFEPDERLYLFLKLTNGTIGPVKARANVYAYFVSLEGGAE